MPGPLAWSFSYNSFRLLVTTTFPSQCGFPTDLPWLLALPIYLSFYHILQISHSLSLITRVELPFVSFQKLSDIVIKQNTILEKKKLFFLKRKSYPFLYYFSLLGINTSFEKKLYFSNIRDINSISLAPIKPPRPLIPRDEYSNVHLLGNQQMVFGFKH